MLTWLTIILMLPAVSFSQADRSRETYRIVNANEFIETFELAAPGKDFEVYVETHFKRKK